jgi:hypothetical protein
MRLLEPLTPLTPRQRRWFWIVALVCGASRFLAMARTLWDWDEALFCLGMRAYDVTSHHPHPPGFPVYIAAAKLARLFAPSDFRALQSVNLIAAVLVFPAMFLLARELRLRFTTSMVAASLFAFLPNVWFFGGTAFSDVPSIVLVVFSVAMLLRGCRDANAYLIGTMLLALSIGIRPQNLLVGLFPGALATWYRARASFRDVVFAALVGTVTVGLAFGSAVYATGSYERYMNAVHGHAEYIARVDSFRAPGRPPLWRLFDRFFIKQYQSPVLSVIASLFALVSAIGASRDRDRRIGVVVLAFAPFAISAWLMLDRFSVNRFSIGYLPMFAILIADGIARSVRGREQAELIAGAALTGAFLFWTLPALTPVRNEVAPSVAAVEEVRRRIDPKRDHLFAGFEMTPFMEYFAPYVPFQRVLDERAMPLSLSKRRPFLLAELEHTEPAGLRFRRERGRLWNIVRRHYFDIALAPLGPDQLPQFVSGWYEPERSGIDEWRWTAGHAVTRLPAAGGLAKLRLQFDVPQELLAARPQFTVVLNGHVIDRSRVAASHTDRDYEVTPAPAGTPNILELTITPTFNPAQHDGGGDPRDLGMQVRYLSWGPV